MGSDAATTPLTPERETGETFASKRAAIDWISTQTDHGRVYVIRNRKSEMVASYGWKREKGVWGEINRAGYYEGYRIGNPHDPNGPSYWQCDLCARPCQDPKHPGSIPSH